MSCWLYCYLKLVFTNTDQIMFLSENNNIQFVPPKVKYVGGRSVLLTVKKRTKEKYEGCKI